MIAGISEKASAHKMIHSATSNRTLDYQCPKPQDDPLLNEESGARKLKDCFSSSLILLRSCSLSIFLLIHCFVCWLYLLCLLPVDTM